MVDPTITLKSEALTCKLLPCLYKKNLNKGFAKHVNMSAEEVEEIGKAFRDFLKNFAEKTGLSEERIVRTIVDLYLSGKIFEVEKPKVVAFRGAALTSVATPKRSETSIWEFIRPS